MTSINRRALLGAGLGAGMAAVASPRSAFAAPSEVAELPGPPADPRLDWPQSGQSASHDFQSSGWAALDHQSVKDLRPLWTVPEDDAQQLIVVGDSVYASTRLGVTSRDLATGALRWKRTDLGLVGLDSGVAYADGLVLIERPDRLWALDAATGATRWTFYRYGRFFSAPVVVGRHVYVRSYHDYVTYCLRLKDGSVRWRHVDPPWSGGDQPSVRGDVVVQPLGWGLVALNRATGEEVWRRSTDVSPGVFGVVCIGPAGLVYVWTGGGIEALDLTTGELVWRNEQMGASSFGMAGGLLVAFYSVGSDRTTGLCGLDPLTGREVWRTSGGRTWSGAFATSNFLIFRFRLRDGKPVIECVGAGGGASLTQIEVPDNASSLVVARERLLMGSTQEITCYGL